MRFDDSGVDEIFGNVQKAPLFNAEGHLMKKRTSLVGAVVLLFFAMPATAMTFALVNPEI